MKQRFNLKADEWIHHPDRKRDYNVALFDEVAPKYDFITKALSLGRDAAWKRQLIQRLPDHPHPQCLDLACGTGDLTFALADKYPDGHVIGLDICESMLDVARGRCERSNVGFQIGDMSATGLDGHSIDIVTGGYALRNAPSIDSVLDEIARVLRPGGTAAFLDFSKPPNRVIQRVQHGVMITWGGFWGTVLHRNPAVYAYIARSLKQFPDRDALRAMLQERGFVDVRAQQFYFGLLELISFRSS